MSKDSRFALELVVCGLAEADPRQAAWHQHITAWLAALRSDLPAPLIAAASYSLGLTLCDDATIAALNQEWRGHSGPTDVLAFAAQEEPPEEGPAFPQPPGTDDEPLELGDIVVSLETAERQAGEQGHSFEREVLFLASHGLLHLLGWDHPDEASLAAMLAQQHHLLTSTVDLPPVAPDSCASGSSG